MIINLKQNEIEAALKAFIANQGINVSNKEIDISFTAGRKESGISAEITIEETNIPGFTDAVEVPQKAEVVTLVPEIKEETNKAEVISEVLEGKDEAEEAPAQGKSLFG